MTVQGPFPLNKGLVSDAEYWDPSPSGVVNTYTGFVPYSSGMRTTDHINFISSVAASGTVEAAAYWQDPAQVGTASRAIVIIIVNQTCYTAVHAAGLSTWTDRTGGVTLGTTPYTIDILNGKVIFGSGGSVGPFKISTWNGNIAALGGTPPHGNLVRVVNNFCFLAQDLGSTSTLSRVYWSNVADPETWGASNNIDVRISDGDFITALSSIGTDLIIFKQNSVWRLSTTTTVTSGGVTLGPLTLISDRVGCAGGLAVDNMPDGTVVFMGTDGHVYQTDGATFNDLSSNPSPSSNIIEFINPRSGNIPAWGTIPGSSYLKVDPYNHRIIVIYGTAPDRTGNPHIFSYDYLYRAWSDLNIYEGTVKLIYPAIIPNYSAGISQYGPVGKNIWFGTDSGRMVQLDNNLLTSNLVDAAANDVTCTYEWFYVLSSSSVPQFLPRSIVIPIRIYNASPVGNLSVTIGWDGTYQSATTKALSSLTSTSGKPVRVTVPISMTSSTKLPTTLQVKIQLSGSSGLSGSIIDPFYLSDEVST